MRVVRTVVLHAASARAELLEVQVVDLGPPRRWRLRIAVWLIRCAGRLARLRVRVVPE